MRAINILSLCRNIFLFSVIVSQHYSSHLTKKQKENQPKNKQTRKPTKLNANYFNLSFLMHDL